VLRLLLILLFLFNFTSCLTLYRLNVGVTGKSTDFRSKVDDGSGNEKERRICVRKGEGTSETKCGAGLNSYQNPASIYPSIEFTSTYFGKSSLGYSWFLDYNETETVLLSYPFNGDETEFHSARFSINPYIFYNWGDREIRKGKGTSFRFGIGPSLNYVPFLHMKRIGSDESFALTNQQLVGTNIFIEYNYNWFTLRVMNSIVYYDGTKFENAPNDTLQVDSISVGFLYSYYFR
jgi:hypothetical protein